MLVVLSNSSLLHKSYFNFQRVLALCLRSLIEKQYKKEPQKNPAVLKAAKIIWRCNKMLGLKFTKAENPQKLYPARFEFNWKFIMKFYLNCTIH